MLDEAVNTSEKTKVVPDQSSTSAFHSPAFAFGRWAPKCRVNLPKQFIRSYQKKEALDKMCTRKVHRGFFFITEIRGEGMNDLLLEKW